MLTDPALMVAVLGPLEVRHHDRRLAVPTGRPTELLVRLALDAGTSVSDDGLLEDLWGETAAVTARNTLQSKVSQLRGTLGEPELVVRRGGGYALEVDPTSVDALRVVELAASASARRLAGDPPGVLAVTGEALALFRGELLVDAGDGPWIHPYRTRLTEVRLGLLEDRLAARVDVEAGGDVIGELEALVEGHPLREGLWVSLVTALYRSGRQADALAALARIRRALADGLGLEPGLQLQALELQILQHDPTLQPAPWHRSAGRTAPEPPCPGNLPALSAALVGRHDELTTVRRLVDTERLVSLVGPAGVGKTRLAIEAARGTTLAGGAWIVRLDSIDAGASVAQTVAEALQVPGGEPMLASRLAGRDLLLVVDNCEHVIDDVADLVVRLLDGSPTLRVLATSQLPLGLDGEAVFALAPLTPAESIELFVLRAAAARPQFVLDDRSSGSVEEICRSLDGLPLAIELAAVRVKSLSVAEISRRLDDRFALLQDPTSRRSPRRRTLAAAVGWAYDLLFPDDQRGLWALACFAGGAPLAAAEQVLAALEVPRSSSLDVFGRLVDRSLVTVDDAADERGTVRYRLLDTIRSFAFDRLDTSGLAPVAHGAHAAWVAETAAWVATSVRGPGQTDCLALVRSERANIDTALAWTAAHDPEMGVRIANGLGWAWAVLGDGAAGAARVRAALAADPEVGPSEHLDGLLLATWLEAAAGDVERAEADLARARRLAGTLADGAQHGRGRAEVDRHLAFVRIQQGRSAAALDAAQLSLAGCRRLGLAWETAAAANLAAFALAGLGQTAPAEEMAREALEIRISLGDAWGVLHSEAMLGAIASAEGRLEEASERLARAATGAAELGFPAQAALHLGNLGRVQWRAADAEAAVDTLCRAIAAASECGDGRVVAASRVTLARVLRATDRAPEAVVELRLADRWYGGSGGGDGALLARALLASLEGPAGHPSAAVAELGALRAEARRLDDRETEVVALDTLARLAAEGGDHSAALRLLREADALAATAVHLVHDRDRVDARRARRLVGAAAEPDLDR